MRCSNYIFILDLTRGFNGLGKDNCKMRRESMNLLDLLCLILEVWGYQYCSKFWYTEISPQTIVPTKGNSILWLSLPHNQHSYAESLYYKTSKLIRNTCFFMLIYCSYSHREVCLVRDLSYTPYIKQHCTITNSNLAGQIKTDHPFYIRGHDIQNSKDRMC